MVSEIIREISINLPTNFVHCTGGQTFEFLSMYFIGEPIRLSNEFIGRERAYSA